MQRYHTSAYRKVKVDAPYPENYYFSYVTHQLGQLSVGEPRARLGSVKAPPTALQYGVNRWFRDTNYKRLREKFVVDSCFAWPVALISLRPRPGFEEREDPLTLPQVARISPRRFFWDQYALSMEEARLMGHIVVRDKDDVRRDAEADPDGGWNLDVLDAMSVDSGLDSLRDTKKYAEGVPSRKEISYFEVWVAEAETEGDSDEGYHGRIYTIPRLLPTSKGGSDKFLREPRDWFGPRWGPYIVGGAYTVPDHAAPLAALMAAESQITELNKHVRAADRASSRRKNVALVDGLKPAETAKIVNSEDGDVIAVKGLDKSKVIEIETGGVTPQQIEWNLELRGRVDRNLAMSDAMRGQTRAGVTATAEIAADANAQARGSFVEEKFKDFESRIVRSVCWYLNESESAVFETDQGLFVGGHDIKESMRRAAKHGLVDSQHAKVVVAQHSAKQQSEAEGSGTSFDDLEIEVESVRDDGHEQMELAALGQQFLAALPIIPVTPYFDWQTWFRWVGEAYGRPEAARLLDMGAAEQQAQQMQAAPGQPASAPALGAQGPPRLGRDVGRSPMPALAKPPAPARSTGVRSKSAQPIGAAKA